VRSYALTPRGFLDESLAMVLKPTNLLIDPDDLRGDVSVESVAHAKLDEVLSNRRAVSVRVVQHPGQHTAGRRVELDHTLRLVRHLDRPPLRWPRQSGREYSPPLLCSAPGGRRGRGAL